jgi:hypothetical protein
MDSEASKVSETVISCSAAGLMAKGIVATWDEAPSQFLPRRGIARAIADKDVRIAHRVEGIVALLDERKK